MLYRTSRARAESRAGDHLVAEAVVTNVCAFAIQQALALTAASGEGWSALKMHGEREPATRRTGLTRPYSTLAVTVKLSCSVPPYHTRTIVWPSSALGICSGSAECRQMTDHGLTASKTARTQECPVGKSKPQVTWQGILSTWPQYRLIQVTWAKLWLI